MRAAAAPAAGESASTSHPAAFSDSDTPAPAGEWLRRPCPAAHTPPCLPVVRGIIPIPAAAPIPAPPALLAPPHRESGPPRCPPIPPRGAGSAGVQPPAARRRRQLSTAETACRTIRPYSIA